MARRREERRARGFRTPTGEALEPGGSARRRACALTIFAFEAIVKRARKRCSPALVEDKPFRDSV